ncbi:MAG: hypothetical protein E7Y34_01985 [Mycoplasma sp.]|nr:hypothetical protein [Mycoplasma sp.]
MITIYISKSFIKNTINLRLKDFKESLNENDIKEKIKKCLIQDELINTNDSINWINDDYKFQGIYIRENNIVVYFCQMLNKQNKTRSRNTYVSQNFMPILDYAKKGYLKLLSQLIHLTIIKIFIYQNQ